MNEQIMQIAERLRGLREALEISIADMASAAHTSEEEYGKMESGTVDIPVSVLHLIAQAFNVEMTALMFGGEPRMYTYFVTRKDRGTAVERSKAYSYASLAAGFAGRKADPFLVTVHPKPDNEPMHLNAHEGEEFNLVLEGRMLIRINDKELILEEGDSIYFNSALKHGMKALGGEKVKFLAIIL
ncbi:MAG: XRE family transcriptional regulator [Tannerellaceae bacterium]|nr:XRE family transcriptional regulator [Tannerellaceae bacterium]